MNIFVQSLRPSPQLCRSHVFDRQNAAAWSHRDRQTDQGRRADRNKDVARPPALRSQVATASSVGRPRILQQTVRIDSDRARHASGVANGIDFALRHGTQVEISE
jgi:hypothetical protein